MQGLCAAGLLLLAACSSAPPAAEVPSLATVRSDNAEEAAERILPPPVNPPQGIASFQSIDLPLDQSLDDAWALVDEAAFPALTRGVWNANGLRVGLLSRADVDEFVRELPPARGIHRSQLLGSAHPTPILRTPRLTGYATIDLTIPPMAVNEIEVTGGRLQLLARLTHDDRGVLVLDLLPHHYVPKLTLKPRGPLEKQLDGRIFEELGLRVEIPPTHLLVIGLYRPWPQPQSQPGTPEAPGEPGERDDESTPSEEVAAEPTTQLLDNAALRADETGRVVAAEQLDQQPITPPGNESGKQPQPEPEAVEPPPLPNHLGRAFFASERLGQNLQTIMLVTIEPLGTPPPTYAPPAAE